MPRFWFGLSYSQAPSRTILYESPQGLRVEIELVEEAGRREASAYLQNRANSYLVQPAVITPGAIVSSTPCASACAWEERKAANVGDRAREFETIVPGPRQVALFFTRGQTFGLVYVAGPVPRAASDAKSVS